MIRDSLISAHTPVKHTDEAKTMEQDPKYNEDIDYGLENDEMSPAEAGFMKGYRRRGE